MIVSQLGATVLAAMVFCLPGSNGKHLRQPPSIGRQLPDAWSTRPEPRPESTSGQGPESTQKKRGNQDEAHVGEKASRMQNR